MHPFSDYVLLCIAKAGQGRRCCLVLTALALYCQRDRCCFTNGCCARAPFPAAAASCSATTGARSGAWGTTCSRSAEAAAGTWRPPAATTSVGGPEGRDEAGPGAWRRRHGAEGAARGAQLFATGMALRRWRLGRTREAQPRPHHVLGASGNCERLDVHLGIQYTRPTCQRLPSVKALRCDHTYARSIVVQWRVGLPESVGHHCCAP